MLVLTKGDNVPLDDVALYPEGQKWVYRDQIVGVVRGYVPFLGWIAIWLREYPWVRNGLVGSLVVLSVMMK
jgi:signal peptidase I